MENQFKDFSTYGSKSLDIFTLSIIPQHIRMSCPNFVKFIELWLKKISSPGEGAEFIHNMLYYANIDETSRQFLDIFCENYLKPLKYLPQVNRKTLVKWIKQWYEAIGSQQSYRFLFRVLFNEDVDFYYPIIDILRPSDGKWVKENLIRIYKTHEDSFYENMEGTIIRGASGRSEGVIERTSIGHLDSTFNFKDYNYSFPSYDYVNIFVSEKSPDKPLKNFSDEKSVILYHMNDEEHTWEEKLSYIVESIKINDKNIMNNFYYETGDVIHVQHSSGYGVIAVVDETESGYYSSFDIVNAGYGYKVGERIVINDKYGYGFYALISKVSEGLTNEELEDIMNQAEEAAGKEDPPRTLANGLLTVAELEAIAADAQQKATGNIEEIKVEQTGQGYRYFPEVSIETENGKDAFLIPRPVNVGSIRSVKIINPGIAYDKNEYTNVPTFQGLVEFSNCINFARLDIIPPYEGDLYADDRNKNIPSPRNSETAYSSLTGKNKEDLDNLIKAYNPYTFPISFTQTALQTLIYPNQIIKFLPIEKNVNGKLVKINENMFNLGDTVYSINKDSISNHVTSSFGTITKIDYNNNIMMVDLYDITMPFKENDELISTDSKAKGYKVQITSIPSKQGFDISIGAVNEVPPYYKNHDGWLNSEKCIQDSYFYQCFSYSLITDVPEEQWRIPVEEATHPAGMIVFHNYGNDNLTSCSYGGDPIYISPRSDTCIPCSEREKSNTDDGWSKISKCKGYKATIS